MKPIFALILLASAAAADTLLQANLEKLRDPASRDAEISRLARCEGERKLAGYHFLSAAQRDGKPPLHLLCVNSEYDFGSSYRSADTYTIEKPEELFGKIASPVVSELEPGLEPVIDSMILVFDPDGKELRPFGGNNFTNRGYYFDFDRDGVLDRADSTNYSVDEAPDTSVEVFKLQSIEPVPRVLLEVIFNWHPKSAGNSNSWSFNCFDEEKDGIVEIAFGPASATTPDEQRQVVFRMDPVTRRYSAGDIPAKSHIRVMEPGDSLASIAKAGGLGYPLDKDASDAGGKAPLQESRQAPYVFHSFKDLPAGEIAAFFKGKPRRDSRSGPEGSFPNSMPEDLWDLDPRQAAMELAEANRLPSHRENRVMALDDRGGIAPPASGWLLHDWGSSGCYSYSSRLFALRFGVPDPELTVFEYNSIGVVGRNPWADQPAHNVRVIKLSEKEARFLADTVFWLDRLRTFPKVRKDDSRGFGSSTADGSATVSLYPDGTAPRELASETVWAASSISANWEEDYAKTHFVNLAELLMDKGVPAMLGERWNIAPELGHHNLATSTEERMNPRVDDDARRKLGSTFAAILAKHEKDPMPAHVVAELAEAAGQEALVQVFPALKAMFEALPELTNEDREFETLEKRFELDHFGDPLAEESADDKVAEARLTELRNKRGFLPSAILREPLGAALDRLRMAGNAGELIKTVKSNPPLSVWAARQLLRIDPAAWSDLLTEQFHAAEINERRMIFGTLAVGSPAAAGKLVDTMTQEEYLDLIIEIAGYHQQQDDDSVTRDIPMLMSLVRSKGGDFYRRSQAMDLLAGAKLDEETLREFTALLVAETRNPQKGEYGMSTLGSAIKAITLLPDAGDHLELITTASGVVENAYGEGMAAIVKLAKSHEQREELLMKFVRPRFKKSSGMMNYVFLDALAHDLRELGPEIAAFASEKPGVADGDGANYSGGRFKGPAGERYHMAREVTALWSEKDPVTLGRLWIFFVAAHPYQLSPDGGNKTLVDLAARKIRAVGKERLREEVDVALKLLPVSQDESSTVVWLRNLAQE